MFILVNNAGMDAQKIESLWSHLHWLIVLAEQRTFTAAANRLGVSKGAMSQRIAELERAVGTVLVHRTTRSVRLTAAGQRLVDETRAPYEQISQSFLGAKDATGEARGLVRVTMPVALGRQKIVPLLTTFLDSHPSIRLEIEMSDRLASLATEGFDLAIRHAAEAPDTQVAWLLCETRAVLVASKDYVDKYGTPQAPQDLGKHRCLHYPRGQGEIVWSFEPRVAKEGTRITVPIAGPMAANNSEALRHAAEAGLGIALIPDFTAQSGIESGRLLKVLTRWRPTGTFADKLFAMRPYSPHTPKAVGLLVRYLREALRGGVGGKS